MRLLTDCDDGEDPRVEDYKAFILDCVITRGFAAREMNDFRTYEVSKSVAKMIADQEIEISLKVKET